MGQAYVPVPAVEQESAELPEEIHAAVTGPESALTPEADALAARAAQLRRTGSTAGGAP